MSEEIFVIESDSEISFYSDEEDLDIIFDPKITDYEEDEELYLVFDPKISDYEEEILQGEIQGDILQGELEMKSDDVLSKRVKGKQNKVELFKELANFSELTESSRFVSVSEFTGKFSELRFGNGGGWSRLDGDFGKKYKVCTIKSNGKKNFSWTCTDE